MDTPVIQDKVVDDKKIYIFSVFIHFILLNIKKCGTIIIVQKVAAL